MMSLMTSPDQKVSQILELSSLRQYLSYSVETNVFITCGSRDIFLMYPILFCIIGSIAGWSLMRHRYINLTSVAKLSTGLLNKNT